jgi:ankyrin repeat protein
MIAAREDFIDVVKQLIESRADINPANNVTFFLCLSSCIIE